MGARGPKPGFRRRQAEAKAAAAEALAKAARAVFMPRADAPLLITGPALTASQKRNPRMLSGVALHDLGYSMGMSRSIMATMSDERVRMSMAYITANRSETESA